MAGKRSRGSRREQLGCDRGAQLVDLLGDEVGVERRAVDELEGPGPDPQPHVGPAGLGPPLHEPAQADVGERAGHVGEHLDHRRSGPSEGASGEDDLAAGGLLVELADGDDVLRPGG